MQGLVLLMILAVVGCSNSKPILYPNEHLKSAGTETAEQDIEACEKMAKEAGANQGSGQAGRVAGSTAVGAGVGAASGAVGGAVVGAAGSGSLIGAASGAVWGLLSGIFGAFFGDSEPNPTYRNFVNRCLQEKGYEVAGWE
ncbi:MAG: glycine zipper family protein [Nitrospiraceae bacterium]